MVFANVYPLATKQTQAQRLEMDELLRRIEILEDLNDRQAEGAETEGNRFQQSLQKVNKSIIILGASLAVLIFSIFLAWCFGLGPYTQKQQDHPQQILFLTTTTTAMSTVTIMSMAAAAPPPNPGQARMPHPMPSQGQTATVVDFCTLNKGFEGLVQQGVIQKPIKTTTMAGRTDDPLHRHTSTRHGGGDPTLYEYLRIDVAAEIRIHAEVVAAGQQKNKQKNKQTQDCDWRAETSSSSSSSSPSSPPLRHGQVWTIDIDSPADLERLDIDAISPVIYSKAIRQAILDAASAPAAAIIHITDNNSPGLEGVVGEVDQLLKSTIGTLLDDGLRQVYDDVIMPRLGWERRLAVYEDDEEEERERYYDGDDDYDFVGSYQGQEGGRAGSKFPRTARTWTIRMWFEAGDGVGGDIEGYGPLCAYV